MMKRRMKKKKMTSPPTGVRAASAAAGRRVAVARKKGVLPRAVVAVAQERKVLHVQKLMLSLEHRAVRFLRTWSAPPFATLERILAKGAKLEQQKVHCMVGFGFISVDGATISKGKIMKREHVSNATAPVATSPRGAPRAILPLAGWLPQ